MSYRRRDPVDDISASMTNTLVGLVFLAVFAIVALPIWALKQILDPPPERYQPQHLTAVTLQTDRSLWDLPFAASLTLSLIFSYSVFSMVKDGSWAFDEAIFAVSTGLGILSSVATIYTGRKLIDEWQQIRKVKKASSIDLPAAEASKAKAYRVSIPRESEFAPTTSTNFILGLLGVAPELTLQITDGNDLTAWHITDTQGRYPSHVIEDSVRTYYPSAIIEPVGEEERGSDKVFVEHIFFKTKWEYVLPLAFVDELKDEGEDPLIFLSNRLDRLQTSLDEKITYSLVCFVASEEAKRYGYKRVKKGLVRYRPIDEEDPIEVSLGDGLVIEKLEGPLFHCLLAVTLESKSKQRLEELAQLLINVSAFSLQYHNRLEVAARITYAEADRPDFGQTSLLRLLGEWREEQNKEADWRPLLMVLHPKEIAALWHLPDKRFQAVNIVWTGPSIPEALKGEAGERTFIGVSPPPSQPVRVYIAQEDRVYHHYIPGKAGTGKSTFIHNLIHQDIAAGRGLVLIDPHGELIDKILQTSIPSGRMNDVDLLDCSQTDFPIPLNPFAVFDGTDPSAAFNSLYWVMRKLYEGVWSETRMDLAVRNLIQALLFDPQATPLDIRRFFSKVHYRKQLLEKLEADETVSFALIDYWHDFFGSNQSSQRDVASPVLNRTGAFLGNDSLVAMTGQPRAIPYKQMITQRRIVLVDLSGEAVKSEINSLGAMLMAGFFMASQALGSTSTRMPRYYLYVDEVEKFVTSALPEILSEVRKFGLSVAMANQYLNQLPEKTLDGIMGNVGTKTVFEVSSDDAGKLEKDLLPEIDRQQLTRLGVYRAAIRTRHQGKDMPAFIVQTPPPPQPNPDALDRGYYLGKTVERYGFLSKQAVRQWQVERYRSKDEESQEAPPVSGTPFYD